MPSHSDRDKRRTVFCQTTVDLKNWETGKEKLISCGIPDTYVPTFYIPEEGPVLRVVNNRPDGIVLVNLETQITCPEALPGSLGDPITIPYGLYFFNINYDDIPDITEDQLHFIASLDQDAINTALSNADFSIVTTLRLSVEQQEFLVNEVAAGLEMLLVTTQNAARGILRCRYTNDPRTECCPDKFFVVDGDVISNCLTIQEGEFFSSRSKADANATVNNVINNWLDQCVTGNDPDGRDPDPDPDDPDEPDEPDCPFGFINTNTSAGIPAGVFLDYSKKEANKKARLARSLLINCEICNDAIVLNCPAGSVTEPFVIGAGEICADSAFELQEIIAETISLADACEFENDKTECSCKDIDASYDAEFVGVFKSTVIAGLYTADSKEEANTLAKEECLADLECYWQNDCVPKCPVIVNDSTNPGGGDGCPPGPTSKVEQPEGCAVPPGKYISDISKQDANEQAIEERGECPIDSSCPPGKACLPESYLAETDQPTSGLPCKVVKTQVQACPGQTVETEEFYYCGIIVDDGGGGGGDGEGGCPEDCQCMTREDAVNSFGKDKFEFCAEDKNNPPPCGVEKANRKAKTPARIKFCVKQKKEDPKDKPCLGGCGCMTPDEAAKAFKKPEMCGEGTLIPCGVVIGDPKKGIPDVDKFCFKEEDDSDDPPPPPSDGCPADCTCGDYYTLQRQNPGKEISACGAEPTICGEASAAESTEVKMCYKIEGGDCPDGCICTNYRDLREKYPDKIFETCNGETTYCGGLDPVNGEQINMCYKDPGEEPSGGGCADGGTGSLQSKGSYESTPTDHLYWELGCMKTNGNVVITDKDVEPQVKVSSAAGLIKIEGNGVYIPAQGSTGTTEPVEVKDGLVTRVNIEVQEMMICESGTVKTVQVLVMKSE